MPLGDDLQAIYTLPFPFVFDGYEYDRIQISTNGWMEFGRGEPGTERGLSTVAQLGPVGANVNGSLGSRERPTKVLGPGWADLTTYLSGNSGRVSRATLGIAPSRVFVVQWKNMRAYWNPDATTTRVNCQVRLYESDYKIEFHYGPVYEGTFGGADIGAMIGFKDHIGGDFHFYDIMGDGSDLSTGVVTDLSPLTDWPGPDSCFVIHTLSTGIKGHNEDHLPLEIALHPNFPNPFNPSTTISYNLTVPALVELKIYNLLGKEIRTLVDKKQSGGRKKVLWDGKDSSGEFVSSGVYLYRLKTGDFTRTRKMTLVK